MCEVVSEIGIVQVLALVVCFFCCNARSLLTLQVCCWPFARVWYIYFEQLFCRRYGSILILFWPLFSELLFQNRWIISVVRWHHNFREIADKNCEKSKNRRKSLCAPLRIDSLEIWRKFHRSSLGPRTWMCTYMYIKKFRTSLYSADSNCPNSYR